MTNPTSLEPDTTGLSPYIKYGSISIRILYYKLMEIYNKNKKHS